LTENLCFGIIGIVPPGDFFCVKKNDGPVEIEPLKDRAADIRDIDITRRHIINVDLGWYDTSYHPTA